MSRTRRAPSPIIRHTPCGSAFAVHHLSYRHGRLLGLPLYCRKCNTRVTEHDIEAVNEIARKELTFLGVLPDPARIPVVSDIIEF